MNDFEVSPMSRLVSNTHLAVPICLFICFMALLLTLFNFNFYTLEQNYRQFFWGQPSLSHLDRKIIAPPPIVMENVSRTFVENAYTSEGAYQSGQRISLDTPTQHRTYANHCTAPSFVISLENTFRSEPFTVEHRRRKVAFCSDSKA